MHRKPTRNAEAYQLYLRARGYERTLADAIILDGPNAVADTLYRRVLALDPDFALARARLASLLIRTSRGDRAQLENGRKEATKALDTRPGLAEAHVALGLYWQKRNDHARALAEFVKARSRLRKSSELHGALGLSYSSMGRWQEAVKELEQALRLDPTNITYAPGLSATYGRQRRYRDSQRNWDRYIARNPDAYWAMLVKGLSVTRSDGIADTLAAALRRIPPEWDDNGMATLSRFYVARLQRRPADALAVLAAAKTTRYEDDVLFIPHTLMWAMAYEDAGDSARSRMYYDSARSMLQDAVAASPGDSRLQIALGRALAGSGKREEAVRAAQRAMALAPVSANLAKATAFMGGAAEIYAYLGETDAALRLLEQLLRMPAGREASVPLLRADPAFDRLRADPRFARMLARFAPG